MLATPLRAGGWRGGSAARSRSARISDWSGDEPGCRTGCRRHGGASSLAGVTTAPIVLVPGFWLGAWAWDDVVAALRADGHDVTAITLPGLESPDTDRSAITLSDHIEAICHTVTAKGAPVVLAVHSGAGVPGYAASDRIPDQLAAMVYVDSGPAAHALDAAFDATELPLPSWPELEAGGSSLQGLSGEQLAAFRERAVPEPGAALRETPRLADERRMDVPSIVVCASMSSNQIKDAVEANHPWVGELAELRDVSYVDLPTGHWPMWSRARELAVILGDAARRSARHLGGVHAFREVPDLLQNREPILDCQDLSDLAVLEVPCAS
jgi:pimeloyl-ACP methyl ester carboxylesterase